MNGKNPNILNANQSVSRGIIFFVILNFVIMEINWVTAQ